MGYVIDWSRMLDTFFQDMYFFVSWDFPMEDEYVLNSPVGEERIFRPLKKAWVKKNSELIEESSGVRGTNPFAQMLVYEREIARVQEGWGCFEAFGKMIQSEKERRTAFEQNPPDVTGKRADDISENSEKSFEALRVLSEGYHKEHMPDDAHEGAENTGVGEAFYNADFESVYGRETAVFGKNGDGEEYMKRDSISVSSEKVRKIIENVSGGKERISKKEIIIEPVKSMERYTEPDMDMTLDMLTERLCDLMAKSADGFYL
ncbi:MAG: hypothetical protein IKU60_00320 [Clostridia bacterium]|nr:hypothetical protein [Clostridia bacterium]